MRSYLSLGEYLIKLFISANSVFLNTKYKSYILVDINYNLIKLYNIIKL
ncbi:DNA adenine methylase [Candidatus Fukatsuia anoeciicola]